MNAPLFLLRDGYHSTYADRWRAVGQTAGMTSDAVKDRYRFTAQAAGPTVVRGEGVWLYTADGRAILDGAGGALVCNVGHGRAEVATAVHHALTTTDYVLPTWNTPNRQALIDTLVDSWLPARHNHAFFACGGSEGNDSAIRLARLHHLSNGQPERWKVIGRTPSYHGSTLATLAAGNHADRKAGLEPLLAEWPKVPWDDASALAGVIEAAGPETVSAFIAEPIIGAAGGALTAEADYWAEAVRICRHYGVLTIVDEVMTGFGRTGYRWGHEGDGWEPDILVSGKGLAGGYQPISVVSAADHVVDPVTEAGRNLMFFTYSGHDASCAAALVVLDIIEREGLIDRAAAMGRLLRTELMSAFADHPAVTAVRGRGLMQGVGLRPGLIAAKVVGECLKRDLWLYPAGSGHSTGDAVLIGPPLIIEESHVQQIVTTLADAINACM